MQTPHAARHPDSFYGWWMVFFCTIARALSAPGQTIGVSVFIDDLIEDLGTSRSAVSAAYLVGTLTSAAFLPFIGRWIDKAGVRRTMTIIVIAFACVIALTATVQHIVMLTVAFVGLRLLGQGGLTLSGTTGVVMWFERRRGLALALSTMGGMAVLSLAPMTFRAAINTFGWRWSWVIIAGTLVAIMLPIARFAVIDRPSLIGQIPDGRSADHVAARTPTRSSTLAQAVRTPAFWTVNGLTFLMGAIATGLTFHNVDLLAERGLSETQADSIFIPQMAGSVVSSLLIGSATDRFAAKPLLFIGGAAMVATTGLATIAEPGVLAAVYGLAGGLALGSIGSAATALMPKWFGVDHIGAIKGVATSIIVAGSAVGPLALSVGNDVAGSYVPVIVAAAVGAAAMTAVMLAVPTPNSTPTLPETDIRNSGAPT